jgi:hypothetical protein
MTDSFKARRSLSVGSQEYEIFSLVALERNKVAEDSPRKSAAI